MQYKQIASVVPDWNETREEKQTVTMRTERVLLITYADQHRDHSRKIRTTVKGLES
jgi:hypothetical protein